MKRRTLFATLAALAVVVASFAALSSHAAPASASTSKTISVTLYDWPDNSPPGADIAYPKSDGYPTPHDSAGGTGTYDDPITFATDWSDGKYHIDLWIGGKGGDASEVLDREDALTRSGTVVIDPPSDEAVSSTPLFNSGTNTRHSP